VISRDVTSAVGIFNIEFWRTLTLLSLCLRHVIWRGTLVGSHVSSPLKRGTYYPHVTCAHVMLRVQLGYLTLNSGAHSHFCHSAYVTWSDVEHSSAHVSARLSNFRCRKHFVMRVECSTDIVTSCFQKLTKCLLKKCTNGPFYMTPSHHITEISIWEPTHGKK
jgi:hypothetical protein